MNKIHYGAAIALNREHGTGNGEPWTVRVQLSPFGEFTLHDGGEMDGAVQRCTHEAFAALVERWKAKGSPDILVDIDHGSALGASTEAAAWAKNLRVEDDGLYADFELTGRGKELVGGKSYRYVSPGWLLDESATPTEICSIGLTNRPNLPVRPVVNAGMAGGEDPDDPHKTKGKNEMDTKIIAAALGLAETATEEEIMGAIAAMKEREAKAAEEAADAEAEAFAADAVKSGKICKNSKEAVKAAYRMNKEVAKEMLNSMAAIVAPKAALPDFTAARTPVGLNAIGADKTSDPVAVYNAYVAMAEGAEKDAYLAKNAAKIEEGFALSKNK